MKSLILTILYLARDTVNRWFTRLSSPVSRVLVVFFLTLCALCFLGTYVISAKVMLARIQQQGGDLVQLSITDPEGRRASLPTQSELAGLLGADSLAARAIGQATTENGRGVKIITYDFPRSGQWLPHLAASGGPTLLVGEQSSLHPGPSQVDVAGQEVDVVVRRMPDSPLYSRLLEREGVLVVQPDSPLAEEALARLPRGMQTLLMQVSGGNLSESVRRAVAYGENYLRLEGAQGHVYSALPLLQEMDIILSNQVQCRVAFCVGIACIVGILLTALAGMEYRQNEYIYTLMKSFGIHPLLLVAAFIAENLLLVGASYVAAVWSFMSFQGFLVRQFFKTGDYRLELGEIMPELQLIAMALLGCVLVSCVPIVVAANRDIGRVLK